MIVMVTSRDCNLGQGLTKPPLGAEIGETSKNSLCSAKPPYRVSKSRMFDRGNTSAGVRSALCFAERRAKGTSRCGGPAPLGLALTSERTAAEFCKDAMQIRVVRR